MTESKAFNFNYRKDIDGLRAIAVLSVLLFHAKISFFSNGFLGVDIFFVISGYLITTILLTEMNNHTFSFRNFYLKRIIRIFPALIFTLIITLILGRLILFPDEFKNLALHTMAGSGFFSNILLYFEVGYFDQVAELKPLLHLWSLGIEEQFYLIVPILIYLIYKYCRQYLYQFLFFFTLTSFVYFVFKSTEPALVFYSPASRFWQIFSGSCLAASGYLKKNKLIVLLGLWAELFFLFLIFILIFSLTAHSDSIYYISYLANILPVVATVFIIAFSKHTKLNQILLQNKPIVLIGKISYPLYLFHWPLIVFVRYSLSKSPSTFVFLSCLALAAIFAFLFYTYFEKYFRFTTRLSQLKKTLILLTLLLIITTYSSVLYFTDMLSSNEDKKYLQTFSTLDFKNTEACRSKFRIKDIFYCGLSDVTTEPQILLIGDSHSRHYFDSLSLFYKDKSKSVLALGRGGCPPFLKIDRILEQEGLIDCHSILDDALSIAKKNDHISTVILAASFSSYFTNGLVYDNRNVALKDLAEIYLKSFEATILEIEKLNKKIIIMKQIPKMTLHPKDCYERNFSLNENINTSCQSNRKDIEENFKNYEIILSEIIKRHPNIVIFDPINIFCSENFCHAKIDNQVLYFDDSHINQFGSDVIADYMKAHFK